MSVSARFVIAVRPVYGTTEVRQSRAAPAAAGNGSRRHHTRAVAHGDAGQGARRRAAPANSRVPSAGRQNGAFARSTLVVHSQSKRSRRAAYRVRDLRRSAASSSSPTIVRPATPWRAATRRPAPRLLSMPTSRRLNLQRRVGGAGLLDASYAARPAPPMQVLRSLCSGTASGCIAVVIASKAGTRQPTMSLWI